MRRSLSILIFSIFLFCNSLSAQLNKDYFFYVGRGFIIENKYQDAIETLNLLLRVDTKAYEGYFLRGIAKYNLDDLLGAEQDFTVAINQNPVYTTAYQYRAITRSRIGNYDDALADFKEAIDLRPDIMGPYYSRGVTYLLSQQFEKAIADFTTFIKAESKVVDAYINRGSSYLMLRDTVSAFRDFNTAIQTNRNNPDGYFRRGSLYYSQKHYDQALSDFDQAIKYDSTYIPAYFNRALVYANTMRPTQAIDDFSRVLTRDSTSSLTYFNRAILRTQIGDYNNAMSDYDKVARYTPNNVLVYYNRAALHSQLGDYPSAVADYTQAIRLYPDFANAYLGRSSLRYMLNDMAGSREDKRIANLKIAEYRSKLNDSTFSIYADTSKRFNQLLSFESNNTKGVDFDGFTGRNSDIALLPMFKFTLMNPSEESRSDLHAPGAKEIEAFKRSTTSPYVTLTNVASDLSYDKLYALDAALEDSIRKGGDTWRLHFKRGVTQTLKRQYTNALASYTTAIDRDPSNPFLYMNRSTTQSEMIDFISSIDNSYQRIAIESDPSNRLNNGKSRRYNYDDAIADLNKAAKLLPDCAYIYYNRANMLAMSDMMPEAIEDYTKAIELNPQLGQAYYNRGLLQIYLKDTRKGSLDLSKAGELGIREAYNVLKIFGQPAK